MLKNYDQSGAKECIEKAGGSIVPVEEKPIKKKFVKTSTKIPKQSPAKKTEEAAAK